MMTNNMTNNKAITTIVMIRPPMNMSKHTASPYDNNETIAIANDNTMTITTALCITVEYDQ